MSAISVSFGIKCHLNTMFTFWRLLSAISAIWGFLTQNPDMSLFEWAGVAVPPPPILEQLKKLDQLPMSQRSKTGFYVVIVISRSFSLFDFWSFPMALVGASKVGKYPCFGIFEPWKGSKKHLLPFWSSKSLILDLTSPKLQFFPKYITFAIRDSTHVTKIVMSKIYGIFFLREPVLVKSDRNPLSTSKIVQIDEIL